MSLTPGDKLGPYEILAPIGKGGMGEVYKARDTRLGREVAIKISAEQFTERFSREARSIAALNHTNICHLYDVGPNYLVMEYVEGETFKSPLKLDEAMPVIQQLIDGIEAAHERNIVHRDLKPANIKITPEGVVKILDFGLARAADNVSDGSAENSPTLTLNATQAGTILGTAAYMAPEQARGKTADRRSDVWSFGAVVYELLTGKRPFGGETVVETLGAVMHQEPDWAAVPERMRRLLQRCLQKDRKHRLGAIGDARWMIEEALEAPVSPSAGSRAQEGKRARRLGLVTSGLAVIFAMTTVGLGFVHFRERLPAAESVRFGIPLPEKTSFPFFGQFAVSPDGRKLVFAATDSDGATHLWVRSLDSLKAQPLTDSDPDINPTIFWSPDSRFIAYVAPGKLKKIDASGGPSQTVCDVPSGPAAPRGGSWNADGTILFGTIQGLMRVSAAGGVASAVTALNPARKEIRHSYPVFLPDGRHFLYLRSSSEAENNGIYVGSLEAKPQEQNSTRLLAADSNPAHVPSPDSGRGRLLFVREGTLLAQPFDARKLELAGDPVPIAEQLSRIVDYSHFSTSANGVLIYRNGTAAAAQLTLFDRQGKMLGTAGEPGDFSNLIFSHDGTKAAVSRTVSGNQDIWVVDLTQGTTTRLTSDPGSETSPVFSPDGRRVAFVSNRGGFQGIYVKASSGAGSEELLFNSGPVQALDEWTRDGRFLIYQAISQKTGQDLWVLPMEGDKKPFLFLQAQFNQLAAHVSPDSRWIAYLSDESGRFEVYVQGFNPSPNAGASAESGKWLISRGGAGGMIHWRKDGKELTYLSADGKVMAVDISTASGFHAGPPQPLFQAPAGFARAFLPGIRANAAPDNDRFIFAVPVAQDAPKGFVAVLNWTAGLKK
jgi:Tol biopolymer transport system component